MPNLLWAVLLLLAGCSSAERGEPFAPPPQLSPQAARGEAVFMRQCHQCHPGGEAGVGPAINNKPLPAPLMKFQVRHGLGAMPSFDERHLGNAELDDLIAYLQTLRRSL